MNQISLLADLILTADKIVAITGAGISTDSGLPDFRGKQGLWQHVDPMTQCSIAAFHRIGPQALAWLTGLNDDRPALRAS